MKHSEITFKINGCAMKVHNTIGSGFQEVIYQRCLAIELEESGLMYVRESEQLLFYKGREVGTRRANFIVEENIVVELKALYELEKVHIVQMRNYLVAYNLPIGLLINFGSEKLQFKKFYNPNFLLAGINAEP
jgi:GxxExxY protein